MNNNKLIIDACDIDLLANKIKTKKQLYDKISYPNEFALAITSPITINGDDYIEGNTSFFINSEIQNLKNYVFAGFSNLYAISCQNCLTIGANAFSDCTNLRYISFPECRYIDESAFTRVGALSSVYFQKCSEIGSGAFSRAANIQIASFPSCEKINNYAFYHAAAKLSLYLMGSSVATLAGSYAFEWTSFNVYVPSSLVNTYKAATNWATYAARIVGI